jgi:hypothetical protein
MVKKMQDVRDEEVFVIRGWKTDSGSVVGFCFGSSREHQRPKAEVDPRLSSLLKAFFPSLHLGRLSTQHLIVQLDARLMNSL